MKTFQTVRGPAIVLVVFILVSSAAVTEAAKPALFAEIIHPNVQVDLLDDNGEATGKKKFINKSEVAVDVDTSE